MWAVALFDFRVVRSKQIFLT